MKLYIKTTRDKYELPVAVADSPAELGIMTGKSANAVLSLISKRSRGWYKIEIEDETIMTMTESEIVRDYRSAKNKKMQISILADLNECKPEDIKRILKDNGVDLRGGNYRTRKPAIINKDFEDAVNEMIESSKKLPMIEAADPVPGEIGYKAPEEPVKPPLGIPPRGVAEMLFNESRIKDIIGAMNRYYSADMAIPEEWRAELKERL